MTDHSRFEFPQSVKLLVIVLLGAAYVGLALLSRLEVDATRLYSHFAYLPIALAAMWWGRRALIVAGALVAATLSLDLDAALSPEWIHDGLRCLSFLAAALVIGTMRDKLVLYRSSLEDSERRHKRLIEKSVTGIFSYRDETITYANPRLETMLGAAPGQLVGRSLWTVIAPEDQGVVRQLMQLRARQGEADLHYECRYLRQDGSTLWVDAASSPCVIDGEPSVLVNVYDITERKSEAERREKLARIARKQEEQLTRAAQLAEVGEMAASIAHELNQPLTAIRLLSRNALYMAENQAGSFEDVAENLGLISGQVDRATGIIQKMRAMARRTEREFTELDLNAVLRETVEFLQPQLALAGIEVSLLTDPALPMIRGDRVRVEQLFINLTDNARDAMLTAPRKSLVIRTACEPDAVMPVVVTFADTGHGFAPEDSRKIFTPFFTTKEAGHGTGLGLSIAMTIATEHGGTIEAEGMPGLGATFTVRFPLASDLSTFKVK